MFSCCRNHPDGSAVSGHESGFAASFDKFYESTLWDRQASSGNCVNIYDGCRKINFWTAM